MDRRRFLRHALAVGACGVAPPVLAAASGRPFTFVAMGCLPYGDEALPKFDRLLAAIARQRPAFALHLGDIKGGRSRCDDAAFETIRARFARAPFPLVYTPGDNEWTDCWRSGFDPGERLDRLQRTFFARPDRSLGTQPLRLDWQRATATVPARPENASFDYRGVPFATVHVVGSNNGLGAGDAPPDGAAARAAEHAARDAANEAWIAAAFARATRLDAPALVLAWQANPFVPPPAGAASGFERTLAALRTGAAAFRRPVLVVHADGHTFAFRRWRETVGGDQRDVPFVQFLQVMGAEDVHAVRVDVDPRDPAVFGVRPLVVPANGPY
jgi:hypothetical protein